MHIIYRLCDAVGKDRPDWFSKEKCLRNFFKVFAPGGRHHFHFVLDSVGTKTGHMLLGCTREWPKITASLLGINERHNARSCRRAFEYALDLKLPDDEILYFVEDDYLHLPGADKVIEEGIELGFDYVTCYDNPDKYMDPSPNPLVKYGGEVERVRCGQRAHWKDTNSTTMTFAIKQEALARDWPLIQEFLKGDYPRDFKMFQALHVDYLGYDRKGPTQTLGSPIPGYSTHVEQKWLAPMVDWKEVACGG